MKASSTNYKPDFIEQKNLILFLRYFNFCKKFLVQTYEPQIIHEKFSQKFKKFVKIYLLFLFLARDLKLFKMFHL